jgi:hypothetical protein
MISRSFRRGFRCRSLSPRSFPRADFEVGLLRDALGKEETSCQAYQTRATGSAGESMSPQLSFATYPHQP